MRALKNRKGFWQSQMIMGLLTAGFGLAILAFPNLLEMLVAGLFIMIGIFMILSALMVRGVQKQFRKSQSDIVDI